jgi:hypothetical protein
MSTNDGNVSSIDTEQEKAERNKLRAARARIHVVGRVVDGQSYWLGENRDANDMRFAVTDRQRAAKFHGIRDADRAARFAGVDWQPFAANELDSAERALQRDLASARGRHPGFAGRIRSQTNKGIAQHVVHKITYTNGVEHQELLGERLSGSTYRHTTDSADAFQFRGRREAARAAAQAGDGWSALTATTVGQRLQPSNRPIPDTVQEAEAEHAFNEGIGRSLSVDRQL